MMDIKTMCSVYGISFTICEIMKELERIERLLLMMEMPSNSVNLSQYPALVNDRMFLQGVLKQIS